ncbi:hypothetical protein Sinac_3999 [Singulisphaera acidiphila DSM 18658]|uniref:Uncharacterized protein n=2 Tax=Singulisphaera acidiphila TaxID=466153 RepID=L0DG33_SINAD|nr:hypothetical protein Sinac_3999 [Singulisphaera acidiphila DSM 18658]
MRRFNFIAIGLVLPSLVAGLFLNGNLLAQRVDSQLAGNAPLVRRAAFTIANNVAGEAEMPHVNGVGGFPVRLNITDSGQWIHQRHLQIFVAIYERPNKVSSKIGKLVNLRTHPDVLVTDPDKESSVPFAMNMRIPPGDYFAFVFLCDPKTPFASPPLKYKEGTFPNAEEFPGSVKMGKRVSVHVD